MTSLKKLKADVIKLAEENWPRMDIEQVKQELVDWLAQLRFPACPDSSSWEECIRVFPPDSGEELPSSGLKVRMALRLFTAGNRYLISIMECFDPDSRGVHILAAHVNWKNREWQMQKTLEEGYTGRFADVLRPKHVVWAQTIRDGQLREALDSCAIAILGNELVGQPPAEATGEPLEGRLPLKASFPPLADD